MSRSLVKFFGVLAIICASSAFAVEETKPVAENEGVQIEKVVDKKAEKAIDKKIAEEKAADEKAKVEEPAAPAVVEVKEEVKVETEAKPTEEKIEEDIKAAEEKAEEKTEEAEKIAEQPAAPGPGKVSVASFINSSGEISVEGVVLSKEILAGVYSPRDYATIWFDGTTPNKDYEAAINFISLADENGLSRPYFDIDAIKKRVEDDNQNEAFVAKTDALITQMVVEMIRLIGNGHKIPKELNLQTYFERPVRVKDPAAAFNEFLQSKDANGIIEKYSPKHPQYTNLKKALKEYIQKHDSERHFKKINYSQDLSMGVRDHTVSEVRKRLGARYSISPSANNDEYDKLLAEKVTEFQRKVGLPENGVVTKDVLEAINHHDVDTISRIKANMERYRWLPDEMPATRIEVNLPNFSVTGFKNNESAFTMGVIAGRDKHETPIMSSRMYQFVLNPYWNVPRAYTIRNMLPLLRQDPDYVKNQNFDLLKLEKDGWKNVDQSSVNWDNINEDNYNYLLRQRPGNINVLGPIKFAIINPYDIFMHSTSEPWLFTNKFRGYSSGCIRVEDPIKFAKFVREEGGADLSDERFDELYNYYNSKDGHPMPQNPAMNDKIVKLKTPIPLFVFYFSMHADDNGNLDIGEDIYDLDFNQAELLGF